MKKIIVTVVYPVTFQTEIDTTRELHEMREQIKDEANDVYESSGISAVILQCDEFPKLVE